MQTEEMLSVVGAFSNEPDPEAQPGAAADPSTSESPDDVETISLDEALAELDGDGAPQDPAADLDAETDPEDAAALDAAELQRQLDEYKAREAIARAQATDEQFIVPWQEQQGVNDDFFDAEVERIQALGAQEGRTQAEIDAAIYNRVELGNGFGIERFNPQTRRMEFIGRRQADLELRDNYTDARLAYERGKTQPSRFEQLASHYELDEQDRTALAKFINYPPDHLEEIARTLGAKNQRVHSTQQNARDQAVANVTARLANGAAPGVPGAPPRQKRVQLDHTRKSTEFVARSLGLVR